MVKFVNRYIIELIGIKLVRVWNGRKKKNVGVLVYRPIGYDGYGKKENVMGQIDLWFYMKVGYVYGRGDIYIS